LAVEGVEWSSDEGEEEGGKEEGEAVGGWGGGETVGEEAEELVVPVTSVMEVSGENLMF
jgi:hypothetical protein